MFDLHHVEADLRRREPEDVYRNPTYIDAFYQGYERVGQLVESDGRTAVRGYFLRARSALVVRQPGNPPPWHVATHGATPSHTSGNRCSVAFDSVLE